LSELDFSSWGLLVETETKAPKLKLEWSRLLGFDQAVRNTDEEAAKRLNDPRMIHLGAKFGCKLGGRRPEIVDVARAR
jgi:hypothetical protein